MATGEMLFNFTAVFWLICSTVFLILCLLVHIPNLPPVLWDLMTFGKANVWGSHRVRFSLERILLVPKKLFWHFYVMSLVTNGYIMWLLINTFFLGESPPQWYISFLEMVTYYPVTEPSASFLSVFMAVMVLFIQGARRLYECFFVSTYSNSTMHVGHYILGLIFYPLTGITVISEGPNLSKSEPFASFSDLLYSQFRWHHIAGVAMFFWVSVHHHRAHVIFANLRKGDKDYNAHKIPRGDWFELVSCPHYFCEILLYVSVVVILGGYHLLAYGMLGFVFTNQLGCGLTSHQWYQTKFDDYPKSRRAIIPWIL